MTTLAWRKDPSWRSALIHLGRKVAAAGSIQAGPVFILFGKNSKRIGATRTIFVTARPYECATIP